MKKTTMAFIILVEIILFIGIISARYIEARHHSPCPHETQSTQSQSQSPIPSKDVYDETDIVIESPSPVTSASTPTPASSAPTPATPTPVATPTPTPEPKVSLSGKIWESEELSADLQQYAKTKADEIGFPYQVFMALMWKESHYRSDVVSKTGDYGLCQINKTNFAWLKKACGITDFMDPKQSIDGSIYIISTIMKSYKLTDPNVILMYYNLGPKGAQAYISKGVYSTAYSNEIMNYAKTNLGYTG